MDAHHITLHPLIPPSTELKEDGVEWYRISHGSRSRWPPVRWRSNLQNDVHGGVEPEHVNPGPLPAVELDFNAIRITSYVSENFSGSGLGLAAF
nr:hypothetical protein Itr_chr11CG18990 [Ipomoea trifida]